MYSEESVHVRFAANPPDPNNADHFICVKYISGQWKYDKGTSTYYAFTPRPTDVLMASINFGTDTITSLQGTNTTEYGIDKGYASGDLSYLADKWNGQTDDGEFSIQLACSGGLCPMQGFTPNRLLAVKKYYYEGSTRVAVNVNGVVKYLFGDHLGSTSVIAKADGTKESERGYKPWGEQRYGSAGVTSFGFTGQRDSSVAGGIMYYGARWYDNYLNRWIQPDTIIPDQYDPQSWDRFAYVRNNPVNRIDPTGHKDCGIACDPDEIDVNVLLKSIKENTGLYWDGLSKEEQSVLKSYGWDRGSFNDYRVDQTSPADALHDPLTYIEIFVVGRGIIKIVVPWIIQSAPNTPTTQAPNLSEIADDIEEWVGQGEKPIAFLNQAGDLIMRNVENTRRFQFHFNNYFPHEGPHFHLDYLNELGEWIKYRIFPP